MWHDCDPWVKVYGACPMGGPPPQGHKKNAVAFEPDPSDDDVYIYDDLEPQPAQPFPPIWVGEEPQMVKDGEAHEQQVLDELEKEMNHEWNPVGAPPHWEKVAGAAILAGAYTLLRTSGNVQSALTQSEARFAGHSKSGGRPGPGYIENWQEKLSNLEGIPNNRKLGWKKWYDSNQLPNNDPAQDPDVGTQTPLEDYGEWYYYAFGEPYSGTSTQTMIRGPSWINPENPQWAEQWGQYWR